MAAPKRKGSLLGAMAATAAAVAIEPSQPAAGVNRASDEMTTTAIHVRKATLSLLRLVAVRRANEAGGRPSVSGVIERLVQERWDELAREAGGD